MMFNIFVKFEIRKCVIVTTKLNFHSRASKKKNISLQQLKEYQALLSKELNIDIFVASKMIQKSNLLDAPLEQLRTNCGMCRKYDIKLTDTSSMSKMLSLKPMNIENRVLLFKEFGATNLNDVSLARFSQATKMKIVPFKEFVGIPEGVDIVQTFVKTVFPKSYEPPPMESLTQDLTFLDLRVQLVSHYVMWRYNISKDVLLAKPTLRKAILFKSLLKINDSVEYLRNYFGWELEKIRKHHGVTRYDINNIKKIHENVKSIGDLSLPKAASKCPKILNTQANSIMKILAYFQQIKIPEASILRCLRILTLDHDTVIERMNSILSNPALTVFRNHKKFLYLVFAYDKLEERMELLHSMNFTCMSLNALITTTNQLQRMYANGFDLSNRQDVQAFLDYEFPSQGTTFKKELQRNPNWLHVPLQQISQSLQYLKKHFSLDDICNNIQAILYHKVELEKIWKYVQDQYENYEGHHFTSSQKLALCLYHLELKHHFTGDGILVSKTYRNEKIRNKDETKFN